MKTTLSILCGLLILLSCSKQTTEDPENKWVDAKLVNKTGLDGCGWELQLNNGDYLEPTNLENFNIRLVNGRPVSVRYVQNADMGSICMIGMVIDIIDIKER